MVTADYKVLNERCQNILMVFFHATVVVYREKNGGRIHLPKYFPSTNISLHPLLNDIS